MKLKNTLFGIVLGAVIASTVPLGAQGSLSNQVLRLLTRANEWTAGQTFDKDTGHIVVERQTGAIVTRTDRLENIGGNLYFNGTLLASAAASGTVSSVAISAPTAVFDISGSPVTSSGTLALTFDTQTANTIFGGPNTGSAAAPTFRSIVDDDIPATITLTNITQITNRAISDTSGTLAVTRGGTGLATFTQGDIPYASASNTLAALAKDTNATRYLSNTGTSNAPAWAQVALTTGVSGTLPLGNGGTGQTTATLAFNGLDPLTTEGDVIYHNGTNSVRLAIGANNTFLKSNGTTVSWAAVSAATNALLDGSAHSDTAADAVTRGSLIYGNSTPAWDELVIGAANRVLFSDGTDASWAQVPLATAVSGTLLPANGGSGATGIPTNGQLLIGHTANATYSVATLTGTANQVTVTNGAGSITLALPQSIATASTPQWARIGLGTAAGSAAIITGTGQFDLGYTDNGNCGAADTVNWNSGETQKSTLSAATCTYTFSNPIAGRIYTLMVIQDGTGGRLVTWPGTVTWKAGAAPTLTATASKTDICTFRYTGAVYLGECSLNF